MTQESKYTDKIIRVVGKIAVITAIPEFHPLRNLSKLEIELDKVNFEGSVLFDLFSVNGLSNNRFASLEFKDGKFDRDSFSVETSVPCSLLDEQDLLIKNSPEILKGSILSSEELNNFLH